MDQDKNGKELKQEGKQSETEEERFYLREQGRQELKEVIHTEVQRHWWGEGNVGDVGQWGEFHNTALLFPVGGVGPHPMKPLQIISSVPLL